MCHGNVLIVLLRVQTSSRRMGKIERVFGLVKLMKRIYSFQLKKLIRGGQTRFRLC